MNLKELQKRVANLQPDPIPPTILVAFLREDGKYDTKIKGEQRILTRDEVDSIGDKILYIRTEDEPESI